MSTSGGKSHSQPQKRKTKSRNMFNATLSRAKSKLAVLNKKSMSMSKGMSEDNEESSAGTKKERGMKSISYVGDKLVDENKLNIEKRMNQMFSAKKAQRRDEVFDTTLEYDGNDNESKGSRASLRSVKTMRTENDGESTMPRGSLRSQRQSASVSALKLSALGLTLKRRRKPSHQRKERERQKSEDAKRFRNLNLPFVPKSDEAKTLVKESLKNNMFFSSLPDEEIDHIVNAMSERTVPKGEVLIEEGSKGDEFYVVAQGSFELSKKEENKVLTTNGKGDSFGELALVHNSKRMITIEALEESQVFILDRLNYRKIMAFTEDDRLRQIRMSLLTVPLLQSLSKAQIMDLADCVELIKFNAGDPIIVKGEVGDVFYLIKSGTVQCTKVGNYEDLKDIKLGPNDYFGERALLVNEPRAANVVALESVECLALDRDSFSKHLGSLKDLMNKNLSLRALKAIPLLNDLTDKQLAKLCASMEEIKYLPGIQIIEQGTRNKKLHIITEGEVEITVFDQTDRQKHTSLGKLKVGDYFGESALKSGTVASAEVTAVGNVTCQVVEVKKHLKVLKPLAKTIRNNHLQRQKNAMEAVKQNSTMLVEFEQTIQLDELKHITTLGTGTFGRVKLVVHEKTNNTYALKILEKARVVEFKQQRNVMNEKMVMMKSQHPFILKLHRTFVSKNCLYFLLELVQGGELFSLLHMKGGNLKPSYARFYAACVVDAIGYLHKRQVVYRDLKPENIMIDTEGYLRVVDFGFAKKVTTKTFTLCGTPEYLPPETITSAGHNRAVDYWAIGVLIYEMIAGFSPFSDVDSNDQDQIFERILRGKFLFPYKGFPSDAKDLVRHLMARDPKERLGMFKDGPDEIKRHSWFHSISFDELLMKKTNPPWIPKIENGTDTRHFEHFDEDDHETNYKGSNKYWQHF